MSLEQLRAKRHADWIKAWRHRLGFCNECGHEYYANEAIMKRHGKSCPKCKLPEHVHYYYCAEHGSGECKECQ